MRDKLAEILTQCVMSSSKSEIVADAIIAALPDMVVPLDWEAIGDTCFRASSLMFGNIRVETYGGAWYVNWSVPGYCDTLVSGDFDTPSQAKASAQADYTRRIMSALGITDKGEG